jgi:hypothetical protein
MSPPVTFATFFPHARHGLRHLAQAWPGAAIKPLFPHFEVAHLVFIFLLGGCAIVLNLRLVGVGFEEPPSAVERHLRRVLNLSVAGVLVSGLLIGIANPLKLYQNPAFFVKMVALAAALLATFAVAVPVARADGVVRRPALAGFVLAMGVWAVALWLFAFTLGTSPGVIHVVVAGALILLAALKGRARWLYLAGLAVIVLAQQLVTHLAMAPDDIARLDPANKGFTWAEAAWIAGFAGLHTVRGFRAPPTPRLAKLIGFCALLMWVTVAAAGRWIAFGG